MTGSRHRDGLFEILLDDNANGFTVIQGAPIHSCDDLRRAQAELAHVGRALLSRPDTARPPR